MRKKSKIDITYKHVKGHQDDNDKIENLDQWALMNILADHEAKEFWYMSKEFPEREYPKVLKGYWSLKIGREVVVSKVNERIVDHIHGTQIMEKWKEKERVGGKIERESWDVIEQAMKDSGHEISLFITKHVAGIYGVAKILKRWGSQKSSLCPLCKRKEETAHHVWMCKDKRVVMKWEEILR